MTTLLQDQFLGREGIPAPLVVGGCGPQWSDFQGHRLRLLSAVL